jgi:pyrroloquinoline quinone biosynthesis protein E
VGQLPNQPTVHVREELRALPQPEPAPGVEAYLRERELALAFSAKRRENYDRYMRSARRTAQVDYLPTILDIENVSRCNFRCPICVVSTFPKGGRAEDMSLDDFKRLIDEQYGLVEIKLHGAGEPLMQGDAFFEMIRYARAQHIWVRIVTNASLLHARDNYRKLVDSDINEIQISIDGADKSTFESIRIGSRFEKVCANCKLINAYCRERGVERTKMWTVVQSGNQHQLEALVDLAHELGFTNQVFSLQLHSWGSQELEIRNSALTAEDSLTTERLLALVDRGAALGVKVWFWNITHKYNGASRETLCPWPFERAYISSDLRTVPCCMIGNPDAYELGKGKGFAETWTSDEYEAFREAHLKGEIPQLCQGCYVMGEHHGRK